MTSSWAEMQNDTVGLHLEGGTVCYSVTTLLILTHTQLQKQEARGGGQVQPSLRWVKSTAVPTAKTHFLTEWLMSDCLCLKKTINQESLWFLWASSQPRYIHCRKWLYVPLSTLLTCSRYIYLQPGRTYTCSTCRCRMKQEKPSLAIRVKNEKQSEYLQKLPS